MADLQLSESKVLAALQAKINRVCSRDEVAQSLWGKLWVDKYSDWMIDTIIYRLRHKLKAGYEIKTLRNQGYVLKKQGYEIVKNKSIGRILRPVAGIQATEGYLEYMNNPVKTRKVLADLFLAINKAGLKKYLKPGILLIINSYSFDNVDSVKTWPHFAKASRGEVVFTHFDERALALHRRRVEELGLTNLQVIYDDIRQSRLADSSFDTVINDFRLNFNTDHFQNQQAVRNIKRILKTRGAGFISVVAGKRKRWFMAEEGLARLCFPVEYYRKLFKKAGFKIIKEFDLEEGQKWVVKMKLKPGWEPTYRRFCVRA